MVEHKKRRTITPILATLLVVLLLAVITSSLVHGHDIALLSPKGFIANEQSKLLVTSTLIMVGFGLPIILTLYFFAWKYREENQKPGPVPIVKIKNSYLLFAWGGPLVIVIVLASMMIPVTKRLQPQRPIESSYEHMTVNVVALPWKWLFIYPKEQVASVNFVQLPVDTPVQFELTADQMPMSSFWIPRLGGMLYAMTGHVNTLNLMADTTGDYPGSTAEINGRGFAGMKFTARATSMKDFSTWVTAVKSDSPFLSNEQYKKLLEPSENNSPTFFKDPSPELFNNVLTKYNHSMHEMDMEAMQ